MVRAATRAAVVSFALLCATASGAQRRPVAVGLGGGATVPIGEYADDVKSGFNGLAFVQYEPERNIWGVRGEVLYQRASYTDEFRGDVNAAPEDELTNTVLYAGGSAVLVGRRKDRGVTPYLIGGLGLYRYTATLGGTISTSTSENGFGFSGGAGLRTGLSSGFWAEVRFHQFSITPSGIAKSTYQLIPVSLGFRF